MFMNLVFHEASSRGFVDHGWLKAHHSFSFADFYNSKKMNFGYQENYFTLDKQSIEEPK